MGVSPMTVAGEGTSLWPCINPSHMTRLMIRVLPTAMNGTPMLRSKRTPSSSAPSQDDECGMAARARANLTMARPIKPTATFNVTAGHTDVGSAYGRSWPSRVR